MKRKTRSSIESIESTPMKEKTKVNRRNPTMTMENQKKTKLNNREIRFGLWNVEKREEGAADDGYYHLSGKAVAFDDPTVLYPKDYTGLDYDINEVMDRGCFDGADFSDVVLNANHGDGNYAVARTRNKSLVLTVKDDGVYIDAKLKKTIRDALSFIKTFPMAFWTGCHSPSRLRDRRLTARLRPTMSKKSARSMTLVLLNSRLTTILPSPLAGPMIW